MAFRIILSKKNFRDRINRILKWIAMDRQKHPQARWNKWRTTQREDISRLTYFTRSSYCEFCSCNQKKNKRNLSNFHREPERNLAIGLKLTCRTYTERIGCAHRTVRYTNRTWIYVLSRSYINNIIIYEKQKTGFSIYPSVGSPQRAIYTYVICILCDMPHGCVYKYRSFCTYNGWWCPAMDGWIQMGGGRAQHRSIQHIYYLG